MAEKADKSGRFRWNASRARAAILLAEDAKSDAEIADALGIARSTLSVWKTHPEFAARIAEHVAELERAVLRYRIAKRRERIRILDDQQTKLLQVQEERAEEYAGLAPGGSTGAVVKTLKVIGSGDSQQLIEEWTTDTGLQHELRALQKQAAQELGQWSEKSAVQHSGGIRREIVVVTDPDAGPIDVSQESSFAAIEAEIEDLFRDDPYPEDAL